MNVSASPSHRFGKQDSNDSQTEETTSSHSGNLSLPETVPFLHCYYNNSLAIRQEIQRFESVHPSIYAIYDLLELISGTDGQLIAQRIREHVVCIEDSFVNSQEWTLSRTVPDLRLGVVGTITSGKSALVHRYLTGSYLQDESPEGGRFKKEVFVDGQSFLLLIRDEGGPPEMQLSCWVDAVLFVFSLESESSFNAVYSYYSKMFHLRSNQDIPIFLVGTQDAISEMNPRVIEETKARKLASELKNCTYFETCATYGLNVEKVFQEACQRIVSMRNVENNAISNELFRPKTPSQTYRNISNIGNSSQHSFPSINKSTTSNLTGGGESLVTALGNITNNQSRSMINSPLIPTSDPSCSVVHLSELKSNNLNKDTKDPKVEPFKGVKVESRASQAATVRGTMSPSALSDIVTVTKPAIAAKPKLQLANSLNSTPTKKEIPLAPTVPKRNESIKLINNEVQFKMPVPVVEKEIIKEQTTPVQTPNIVRKNRRKSNLFTPLSGKSKNYEEKYKNGEVGSGRVIPIKQGYLYKKSKKTLNKDWKKKYVTLTTDGCLTYHPTLHDYMDDVHGKHIPLKHTTVKVPGQKPRCSGRPAQVYSPGQESDLPVNLCETKMIPSTNPKYESSSVKKRSRRLKSMSIKNNDNGDDSDGNEFVIVSLENKQWHFNAANSEDREEWVCAIEQQILSSLQNTECAKVKLHYGANADQSAVHSIHTVPGNKYCADCDAPNPDWASLNLGALICIECSGIHRNLGTHISKVRSLTLDVWPASHVSLMLGLGNTASNKIWEYNLKGKFYKPTPTSSYEEKERFIRAKYENKLFLAPLLDSKMPLEQQIIQAVYKMNVQQLALLLAHLSLRNTNLSSMNLPDRKSPLHIAASLGCLEIAQLLLWYNVDEKAVDAEDKTALFYARISGHKEVEELLLQSGGASNAESNSQQQQSQIVSSSSNNEMPIKRRESIPLNFKSVELFNKLPASII